MVEPIFFCNFAFQSIDKNFSGGINGVDYVTSKQASVYIPNKEW